MWGCGTEREAGRSRRREQLMRNDGADAVLQTNLPGIINGCITPPAWQTEKTLTGIRETGHPFQGWKTKRQAGRGAADGT